MDLCGRIYVSNDFSAFSLNCTKCEDNLLDWSEFVEHIRNCLSDINDEPYIDVPGEGGVGAGLVVLDIVENFSIKEEHEADGNTLNLPLQGESNDTVNELVKCELNRDDKESTSTGSPLPIKENPEDDECFDDEMSQSSSSDDDSSKNKRLKKGTKFTPSFHRHNKCTPFFIELYKNQPCLWDENHINFKDPSAQKAAYKTMSKSIKKNFQVVIKKNVLKSLIARIRQQYYSTQENIKDGLKSKIKSIAMEYFKMCSFLGEIDEKREEEPKTGNSVLKSKCLVFSSYNKEFIETLLDCYKKNSLLYDSNHQEFSSTYHRGLAYNDIVETLKTEHNIELSSERLSNLLRSLREWYHRISAAKRNDEILTDDEVYYLDRCSFLPDKVKRQKYSCNLCDVVASSENTIQVHMVEKHKVGELPHKCEECNRFFRQKSSLICHKQRSHLDKKFECEYCHHKFSVLSDYRLHIRTHTEEKPYVCELCGKAFRIRTQLGYHVTAIHTKVRAFKCNICPKDFLKAVHLRDHIKSHLNIRDKICETCGKGFTNCHSLIRHRQIHSEVKKFQCKLCDAKFHQFVGLNSHMKRTHNIVKQKPKNE